MEKTRINKYLAGLGIASRREIDRWIEENQIKVNGKPAESGIKVDATDIIEIRGKKVEGEVKTQSKVYYLLNKPKNVISASKDNRGRKTVVDCIRTKERIFPIGRLDFETEGAIILTNDGDLFNKIIHPRTEVFKEYQVEMTGLISDREIERLQNGVVLEDGITLPAHVNLVERNRIKSKIKISIREGRNRQVRRMIEALGHKVLGLIREKIGKITIEGLPLGDYRELTKKEIEYLYSLGK
ncbi:MAG: pseudouridine synthase [Fusobacteriaceae bacterium]